MSVLDDIHKRLQAKGQTKPKLPSVAVEDLASLLHNLINDAVQAHLAGTLRPADQPPLSARIEQLQRSMARAHAQVPKPAASSAPVPSAVPKPAQGKLATGSKFLMSIIDRDHRGGIWHTHFVGPDGKSFIGTVDGRDANGRIQNMTFELVA